MAMTYEKVAVFTCDECGEKRFVPQGEGRPEGWGADKFCSEKCMKNWMTKNIITISDNTTTFGDNTTTFGDKNSPLVIRNAGAILEFRLNSTGHIRTSRLRSNDVEQLIRYLFNWMTKNFN